MTKEDTFILRQAMSAFETATPDGRQKGLQLLKELAVQEIAPPELVTNLDKLRDAIGVIKSALQFDYLRMEHLDLLAKLVERMRESIVFPGDQDVQIAIEERIPGLVDSEQFADEIAKLDDRIRALEDRHALVNPFPIGTKVRVIDPCSKFYGEEAEVISIRDGVIGLSAPRCSYVLRVGVTQVEVIK